MSARRSRVGEADRFAAFHRAHPEVLRIYELAAEYCKAWGVYRLASVALLSMVRVRTRADARETMGESYKLPNVYGPYYARLLIAKRPDLAPLFHLRKAYRPKAAPPDPGATQPPLL